MSGRVAIDRQGALGFLIFDHAERRNAISAEMWREIPLAARELDQDDAVRMVILRGAGDTAFVAGADISEFERTRSGGNAEDYDEENGRAFAALAGVGESEVFATAEAIAKSAPLTIRAAKLAVRQLQRPTARATWARSPLRSPPATRAPTTARASPPFLQKRPPAFEGR